jgi:hypothetical protein
VTNRSFSLFPLTVTGIPSKGLSSTCFDFFAAVKNWRLGRFARPAFRHSTAALHHTVLAVHHLRAFRKPIAPAQIGPQLLETDLCQGDSAQQGLYMQLESLLRMHPAGSAVRHTNS